MTGTGDTRAAMGFGYGQPATCRKFGVLTVVAMFSLFPPMVEPRFSFRGEDAITTLKRICACVGYPARLVAPSPFFSARHLVSERSA